MAEKKAKTDFEKLYEINVNDKTEKKNGLTYLSWAWAWAEFKKVHPTATYEIKKFEGGIPYAYDENTGYMVYTSVTVDDLTHEMWLPVMDSNNKAMKNRPYEVQTKYKAITVQPATMFDINKAIMRCLTKNLAMFGLGLYIYAGEDLPDSEEKVAYEEAKAKNEADSKKYQQGVEKKKEEVKKLMAETDADVKAFLVYFTDKFERQIDNVDMMVAPELDEALKMLKQKKADQGNMPKPVAVDVKGATNE